MPLYEYECGACGHRFEVIQKFSDSPIERCPECNEAVHKLLSRSAFQFKGTGWYVTDYASKRNTEAAAAASSSSSSASGTSKPTSSGASDSSQSASTSDSSSSAAKTDAKPAKSE